MDDLGLPGRKRRGNGAGSIFYKKANHQTPWGAMVTIGWANDKPVRRSRMAATREEAEALLERMLAGDFPDKRRGKKLLPAHRTYRREMPNARVSKRTRFLVLRKCSFACSYCGRRPPAVVLEVDHIVPVSKGGATVLENLTAACEDCNRGKANLDASAA